MEAPSLDTKAAPRATEAPSSAGHDHARRQHIIAMGGIFGALAVSSCCVLPLILFSVGLGGAWIGNLTALAPYKPLFAAATTALIGYGFYLVYWKPKPTLAEGSACAQSTPNRFAKFVLWTAAILAAIAFAFDYVAPLLLA